MTFKIAVMRSSILRRLASLVVAIVMLGATSAIPWHSDVDHTAEETHVERAHGGHDAILMQHTDDRIAASKIVPRPAPAARLCLPTPSFSVDAPKDAAKDPPLRPPDHQSRPRAPPALT